MALIYLWVNAALYVGLSAWCTIWPDKTAKAIGFSFDKPAARSEYVTVYGGLEMALAVFFVIAALSPSMRSAGLLFALVSYGCLATFRIGTLLTMKNVGSFPLAMLAIELPMAIFAALLYAKA